MCRVLICYMTAPSSSPERTNSVQSGTARGRRGQRKCQRDFDVVVFGCTGFVGKLVLEKMHRYGKAAGLRVAAAGRDEDKVKQVRVRVCYPRGPGFDPWLKHLYYYRLFHEDS